MPRKARPIPKQQFPTGLPYGKQKALQEQAAALPQTRPMPRPAPAPAAAPAAPMNVQPAPAGQPQQSGLEQLMQQGWDMPATTPFNAPSQRPMEPVTAGLPVGPGAGTEVLPQFGRPDLSQFLLGLAAATGDDTFVELANLDMNAKAF